jgi:hypothetical protein
MLYRYPSLCDEFSARVDDRGDVEAVPVIRTLSHTVTSNDRSGRSVLQVPCLGRVHITLVEYNYLDRVVFPFQELRQLPVSSYRLVVLRFCNITDAGHRSPDALVRDSAAYPPWGDKKTTSLLPVFHFSPHSGEH